MTGSVPAQTAGTPKPAVKALCQDIRQEVLKAMLHQAMLDAGSRLELAKPGEGDD